MCGLYSTFLFTMTAHVTLITTSFIIFANDKVCVVLLIIAKAKSLQKIVTYSMPTVLPQSMVCTKLYQVQTRTKRPLKNCVCLSIVSKDISQICCNLWTFLKFEKLHLKFKYHTEERARLRSVTGFYGYKIMKFTR